MGFWAKSIGCAAHEAEMIKKHKKIPVTVNGNICLRRDIISGLFLFGTILWVPFEECTPNRMRQIYVINRPPNTRA